MALSPHRRPLSLKRMSTAEILHELARLSPAERREIARRLAEMDEGAVELAGRGIDEKQANDLRARLASFAEDWDSPEMNSYDNYDAAKASVSPR